MGAFFVRRPAIAWVIAAFITLFGLIALSRLPVEQYPAVAPPTLTLRYAYDGADAETVDGSVTAAIDRELNGIGSLLYRSAVSRADGTGEIVLTFAAGSDLNAARTDVQDRLNRAEPRLPEEVRRLGIRVRDNSTAFLLVVAIGSRTGATSPLELGDFAATKVVNELSRVPGVGNVNLFTSEKAMRVWLDTRKLAGYRLTPSDVLRALREQNSQIAAGGVGDQPLATGGAFNARIVAQRRFTRADQFRDVMLRARPDGSAIRLGDVAHVEIGAESYANRSILDGREVAGMAIQLASGANAIATKRAVIARMRAIEPTLPRDMTWSTPYDTTPFIETSIANVVRTIVEAMLLVFLVMFLFLGDWRATLIPALVVPIALLGGCLGLWLFGFSINQLSLFAMVLAVGILVDDAIVVVENVDRLLKEGRDPASATIEAVGQIRGAVIGITLVLIAVFVPMAFFPGSTGAIYRQFSLTLIVTIFFSALLALTLTPALCATVLRHDGRPARGLGRLPALFLARLDRATARYTRVLRRMLARPLPWLTAAAFLGLAGLILFARLPGGFLPDEDQGQFIISYDAPPGTTADRTAAAVARIETVFRGLRQADNIFTVTGFNFFGQGQSAALSWATLKPHELRPGQDESVEATIAAVFAAADDIPGASIFAVNPPAIDTLGNATGFTMKIEDRGGGDAAGLARAMGAVLSAAAADPRLAHVRPQGQDAAPELAVDIDRNAARAFGLAAADVDATLAIAFGSAYADDYIDGGAIRRVYVSADAGQRMRPDDVLDLQVRGDHGRMVPFAAFSTVRWTVGPTQLERYNGYAALSVSGQAAPGHSSGEALVAMEGIARDALGAGQTFEWTGTAFEEKRAAGQIGLLLALSVVIVFLVLVTLYNSWSVPFAVLLVVPLGMLGAVALTAARGFSADVYFNVGLVTIVGLAAKNAILIVEFARDAGQRLPLEDATLLAASQRLRPILMTSAAFILGMLPLVFAHGAGAAGRRAVGTGVMGGMIGATILGIFLTPLFHCAVQRLVARVDVLRRRRPAVGIGVGGDAHA